MKVRILRVDKTLPVPQYKTQGAAGFDFYVRETTIIPAKGWAKAPANTIIQTPPGYALKVMARSSLAKNYPGIFLANSVGLIDSDFCGPNDEIMISLYNMTDQEITITRGDRIAQGVFVKFERADFEEVEEARNNDRGGFGSTGKF